MAAVAEQSALGGCGAGRASNANEAASTPSMPSFERVSCPANTKLCLQLAIGKWLDTYVLKAKRLIGEFLLGDLLGGAGVAPAASKERDPPDDKSTAMCLSVEAMGSGKLLVPQINVVPTSTIRELKHLIVSRVPGFATATTRIFKGHGGYELSRENQTLRAYGMQDGAVIVATTSMDDRTALTALFYVTNGPSWARSARKYWRNPNKALQKWSRVSTYPPSGPKFGRVQHLLLSNAGLSGPIPAVIGQLDQLVTLHMDHNRLTGHIPSEIGKLTNLKNTHNFEIMQLLPGLDLSHNALTGAVPPEVATLCNSFGVALNDNANGTKGLQTRGLNLMQGRILRR